MEAWSLEDTLARMEQLGLVSTTTPDGRSQRRRGSVGYRPGMVRRISNHREALPPVT